MKYEAIFFDIDDTILDYAKSARLALVSALNEMHLEFREEYFTKFMELDKKYWDMQKAGIMPITEVVTHREADMADFIACSDKTAYYSEMFMHKLSTSAVLVDDAEDIIKYAFEKGYKLYTASNGFYKIQKSRLDTAGLLRYFNDVFVSDIIGFEKPHGGFLTEALSRAGICAEKVLMVGDSIKADMAAAHNANTDACFFDKAKCGTHAGQYYISALSELKNII